MVKKITLAAFATALAVLVLPATVRAYGACHVGYTHVGPNGVYHTGETAVRGPGGTYATGHTSAYGAGARSITAGTAPGLPPVGRLTGLIPPPRGTTARRVTPARRPAVITTVTSASRRR